jgi:hypothetical protein
MPVPRWFYPVLGTSAGLVAIAFVARSISEIGVNRFPYQPKSSSHNAVVFDGRTGIACEWVVDYRGGTAVACRDFRRRQVDIWREKIVKHFAEEPAAESSPADTGMKMMDSLAPH